MKNLVMKFLMLVPLFLTCQMEAKSEYQAENFNHLLGRLKGIDDPLLKMHFALYRGYVKNTNLLLNQLQEMAQDGQDRTLTYGALKRRMGWEMDGMLLHELYFSNLGKSAPIPSKSALYQQIEDDFGSYAAWMQDYKATGMIRGIGWVILYQDPKNGNLHNVWINEHDLGHIVGGTPLLVMDVWEHAYITEYGLDRMAYINAFFENINWSEVESRHGSRSAKRLTSQS